MHTLAASKKTRWATGITLVAMLALVLAMAFPAPAQAHVVPLVNGGFEAGDNPPTGWTVSGTTGIDVVKDNLPTSGWDASEGLYSIDLNSFHAGTISQSFATYVGGKYIVTFDLAGNPGKGGVVTLNASAAAVTVPFSFDTTGRSEASMGWTPKSFNFTATAANTTVTFTSTTNDQGSCINPPAACGPALDRISVVHNNQAPTITNNSTIAFSLRERPPATAARITMPTLAKASRSPPA